MKVLNFNDKAAISRLETARLNEITKNVRCILSGNTGTHEIMNAVCAAINDVQMKVEEDSARYRELQFQHDVIEAINNALELRQDIHPVSARMTGINAAKSALDNIEVG